MDTDFKQSVDSANIISSNDERSNSGLREGNIAHAEVNAALRAHEKTIIFGQQNRLRDGLLMEDEKLERYHFGHELVKFFYSGVRQLPEYLVDALLAQGVSVTLVKSPDLLVFRHVRAHQSFHAGRARKTIYMPEAAVAQAFDRGYDYWAIGEVIIQESWPLLDFLLILELVRRAQVRLRKQYTLGREFVLKTLRVLNKHRKERVEDGADGDSEFDQFLARYSDDLYRLNREILERDVYLLADEIFDEELERKWAHIKIYDITQAFNYPTYFNIDRDIVHPAAFEIARRKGLATEPETIEDILHDLDDAARFEVAVQTKTNRLLDKLIDQGEPGIRGFVEHGWSFSLYYGGGYYPVAEFKNKLQALSSSPPEGDPGSISNDFTRLMNQGEMDGYEDRYRNFEQLSFRLKRFMALNLVVMSGTTDIQQLAFEIEAINDGPVMKCMVDILWQYYLKMDRHHPDLERFLVAQILKKLNQHPRYHDEIILQYRRLADDEDFVFRASIKEQVERLSTLIPDKPLRLSYDAQRLRTRLHQFEELRQRDADDPQLISLLAGILLRLDRCNEYPRLVREVYGIRELVRPVFEELVEQISPQDQARRTIRQMAQRLLRRVELDTAATLDEDSEQRYAGEGLVGSLYRLMGHPTAARDQPLSAYALDEKWSAKEIARELQRTKLYIPLGNRTVIALVFTGINSDKE